MTGELHAETPKPLPADVGPGRIAWFDLTTTIRVAEGNIAPFNGVVYVQVSDLPASCNKVKELGGTIPPGFPFNLPDGIGAIALILDPAGHRGGLAQRLGHRCSHRREGYGHRMICSDWGEAILNSP